MLRTSAVLGSLLAGALAPAHAQAFCGFYVAGADAKLFNDATIVVLMRDGTRTVVAMQNAYEGPPEDFALVVPVPVVLREDDVKTLRKELFARVDTLAAPRLVEYWEQDPCEYEPRAERKLRISDDIDLPEDKPAGERQSSVKIEAQFEIAEYEVVILSATESDSLDAWLREHGYGIPAGAERLLRPYVEQGMKFFVAKVDPGKVEFAADGRAMLSPLRFHYDSDEFTLPIRLGLINAPEPASGKKQDLLIHILARGVRYEAANYPNVTIPTNREVSETVRDHFGEFYGELFEQTLAAHAGAIVTEYAWSPGQCDPCPSLGAPLTEQELFELGADVLPNSQASVGGPKLVRGEAEVRGSTEQSVVARYARLDLSEAILGCYLVGLARRPRLAGKLELEYEFLRTEEHPTVRVRNSTLRDEPTETCIETFASNYRYRATFAGGRRTTVTVPYTLTPTGGKGPDSNVSSFVLSRLHARYDATGLGEDLVFQTAAPIVGGTEYAKSTEKALSSPWGDNNFQARYVIRHPWVGAIDCKYPERGRWGGPNGGEPSPIVARGLTPVPRTAAKPTAKVTGSPSSAVLVPAPARHPPAPREREPSSACVCSLERERAVGSGVGLLMLLSVVWRRWARVKRAC
jgi:hypothetical protein